MTSSWEHLLFLIPAHPELGQTCHIFYICGKLEAYELSKIQKHILKLNRTSFDSQNIGAAPIGSVTDMAGREPEGIAG